MIEESGGATTLNKLAGKLTDSYTIRLATPPTARVYMTISAAYSGGIPYAQVSIDGGLTFHDQVILVFEAGEVGPVTVIVRLNPTAGDHPFALIAFMPTAQPGPGRIVETVSHSVSSDDPLYDNAAARNVYINADAEVPDGAGRSGGPRRPGGPDRPRRSRPQQPSQPGDAGGADAEGDGDLAATGAGDLTVWTALALLLLALGLALSAAGRRRRA